MRTDSHSTSDGSRPLYPLGDAEAAAAWRESMDAELAALEAAERADRRTARWVWGFALLATAGNVWLTVTNPYIGIFFALGCALAARLWMTVLRRRR